MNKRISIADALSRVRDGAVLMIGGFIGCGGPSTLVEGLLDMGVRNLTIIANDATRPEFGIGKLVVERRVKKMICTHIGTNPEAGRQMAAGELEVELVPQGTFAERIRAAGAGLGGVITPTGVGTLAAEGKRSIEIEGREYLIELPLSAELALIGASGADEAGNLIYEGSTRNSNTVMATAAKCVICEVPKIVPIGTIDPNNVVVPGIYIDHLVLGKE